MSSRTSAAFVSAAISIMCTTFAAAATIAFTSESTIISEPSRAHPSNTDAQMPESAGCLIIRRRVRRNLVLADADHAAWDAAARQCLDDLLSPIRRRVADPCETSEVAVMEARLQIL